MRPYFGHIDTCQVRIYNFYYRKTTTSGSGTKKGSTSVVSMTSIIPPKYAVSQCLGYLKGKQTGLATIGPLDPTA